MGCAIDDRCDHLSCDGQLFVNEIGWIKNELDFKIPKQVVKLFELEK